MLRVNNATAEAQNIGNIDRMLRFAVGFAIIIVSLNLSIVDNLFMSYEIALGSLIALTGIIAWDPLYAIFAILRKIFSANEKIPGNTFPTTA